MLIENRLYTSFNNFIKFFKILESILSLYGNGASTSMPQQQQQPQMFGVPGGVYTMNNMNPYQQQQARQQQQPSAYQQQQPNTVLQQQQGGMNQV